MTRFKSMVCLGAVLVVTASAQQSTDPNPQPSDNRTPEQHHGPGAAKDIGSGAGDVGVGAAKGAGAAAKGVGKGAVDLVTLHPVDAAASVGKGAVVAGKDVTVGSAKGAGRISRGFGKLFKKIF